MTYAEIFVQILSEVSGKPKEMVSELLKILRQINPGGKWDEKIPDHKVDETMAQLRSEAPGILAWLREGAVKVERSTGRS